MWAKRRSYRMFLFAKTGCDLLHPWATVRWVANILQELMTARVKGGGCTKASEKRETERMNCI